MSNSDLSELPDWLTDPPGVPPVEKRPRGRAEPPDNLDTEVQAFAANLKLKYANRIKRRPKAFKRRVLMLLGVHLPPHPKPTGRPPQTRITRAAEMYLRQQRERKDGTRKEVNWVSIGRGCIPGFDHIKSEWRRRMELAKLRNSVHARLRRKRGSRLRPNREPLSDCSRG